MTLKRHVYALTVLFLVLGGAFAVMQLGSAPVGWRSARQMARARYTPRAYQPMASSPPCNFTGASNYRKVSGNFSMALTDLVGLRGSKSKIMLTSFTVTTSGGKVTAVTANMCMRTGSRFSKKTFNLNKPVTIDKRVKLTVTGATRSMVPWVPSTVNFKLTKD
ncbi:MAG: hypothetical protein KAW41_00280 [Candidatus Diapherotrites archaeon]|nr:hypothetical protein [Candidatus Diapherotrites archaeon]